MTPLQVYIGFDTREPDAFEVAAASLTGTASCCVNVVPLRHRELRAQGLIRRPFRMKGGSLWDDISDAPMSTEFAITRFLTPLLAQRGWALFCDCDVVFLDDVAALFNLADERYAVQCVHHDPIAVHAGEQKMDGRLQVPYARKNWSSVMLFNCDHPANARLTLDAVNSLPGRELHAFRWLDDAHVGTLPAEWNWLVNVQAPPVRPALAHFTLGGPWLPGWKGAAHDSLWLDAQARGRSGNRARHARAS